MKWALPVPQENSPTVLSLERHPGSYQNWLTKKRLHEGLIRYHLLLLSRLMLHHKYSEFTESPGTNTKRNKVNHRERKNWKTLQGNFKRCLNAALNCKSWTMVRANFAKNVLAISFPFKQKHKITLPYTIPTSLNSDQKTISWHGSMKRRYLLLISWG